MPDRHFFVAPSRLRLLCSSTPRQASLSGLIGGRRSPFCLCIFYAWGVQSSSVVPDRHFFCRALQFVGLDRGAAVSFPLRHRFALAGVQSTYVCCLTNVPTQLVAPGYVARGYRRKLFVYCILLRPGYPFTPFNSVQLRSKGGWSFSRWFRTCLATLSTYTNGKKQGTFVRKHT